eukprot:scpid74557/ scgid17694/ 
MANGAVRGLKIILYLVVVGASAGMLYGFVKASASIDDCVFGGGNCVLFASMGNFSEHRSPRNDCTIAKQALVNLQSSMVPVSGKQDLCRFCLASASMQMIVCLLGALLVYYRWSSQKPNRSACSILELIVVVLLTTIALLTAALVTAGLEVFCRKLLSDWDTSFMHHHGNLPKPPHCAAASLFKLSGDDDGKVANVDFHAGMYIARACSFIAAGAWLFHLLVSAISVHSYRKNGPTPMEEIQSERERSRADKEKKKAAAKGKKSKDKKRSGRSGRRDKHASMWDESVEMV